VQRVLVAGISGSGKSTFARELCRRTALPYFELDAFFHGPGWSEIPTFEHDVAEVVARDEWVFDSHGYSQVRDLMWSRVDTVVWLDFSRPVVTGRAVRRSFARARHQEPIFNGNTESFRAWLDPEHPVQWSVRAYAARRDDMLARFADPAYAGIRKVRLRTPVTAQRWIDLAAPDPAPRSRVR
jgi:adenylate kinase family enzyme